MLNRRARWAAGLAVALVAQALLTLQSNAGQGGDERVYFLIRHAEKESAFQGDAEWKNPLSERGIRRAECLARVLRGAGVRTVVTTSIPRVEQTAFWMLVAAASEGRKMGFQSLPREQFQQAASLASSIAQVPAPVLIVGQSDTIRPLAEALGGPSSERMKQQMKAEGSRDDRFLASNSYDWLLVARVGPDGAKSLSAYKYGPDDADNPLDWRSPVSGGEFRPCAALKWPLP
jgi:phosphohistidine phosphatase SixA